MADQWAVDRLGLQDVMLKYAAGVDERDFDLYRSCFADDVVVEGFGEETVEGGDAYLSPLNMVPAPLILPDRCNVRTRIVRLGGIHASFLSNQCAITF